MSSAVPGFKQALREYESEKVKDRVAGGEKLREIFGNRETLSAFQESASKDSGAGWTRLFEVLYTVVGMEKRAVMKRNSTAQAEKRLAEAISLVRWMAERSIHYLSRRPLLHLVRHMSAALVHNGALFQPAVRDYAKALRTVLSYPPHLEAIEEPAWRQLISICWAGALGDQISGGEQFDDEGHDELDETQDNGDMDDDMLGTSSNTTRPKTAGITQGTIELLNLIPILLSSPSAPLLPLCPHIFEEGEERVRGYISNSVGNSLLLKTVRFLEQHPTETSGHLPILRSCNIILVELELNNREEIIKAGAKLLPLLVGLWFTRNKPLREQLLIALRLLLPWLSHESVEGPIKEAVQEGLSKLADALGKESSSRWGIAPLDLQYLRIASEQSDENVAFQLGCIRPGFDFSHEMAFAWTVQELYADVIFHLRTNFSQSRDETSSLIDLDPGRSAKRRRIENPLTTLISGVSLGSTSHRLLSLQILTFITSHHSPALSPPDHLLIRAAALESMEADDESLQSWAFICLASIQTSVGLGTDADRVWASATRKIATPAISRAAAFCANAVLRAGAVGSDVSTRDIGNLLRQIDIQGPPHPLDSICHFLTSALELAQSDVRLYSQNLEDKVLAWLARHDLVDGPRGRTRMDARSAGDILRLLCTTGNLAKSTVACESSVPPALPECPIVERVLEELRVRPVRLFVLRGEFPTPKSNDTKKPSSLHLTGRDRPPTLSNGTTQSETPGAETFLIGRQLRISDWLKSQIRRDLTDWQSQTSTHGAKSSERVRKSLDLAVLAILFQTTLQSNGVTTDAESLNLISQLLLAFRTELANGGQVTTQLFLWQAFQPLLPEPVEERKIWPIALRAADLSGIRSELLPKRASEQENNDERISREDVLVSAWRLPEVAEALREIVLVARRLTDDNVITPTGMSNPTQRATQHVNHDDDDFGDIRIAETDAMPVSKEALDSQRSAVSLLRTIVTFRLTGAKYASLSLNPPKDAGLLNAFLCAEGPRMIQLGRVICEAVSSNQLRLNPEAIEAIIGALEEVFSSYGYSRDEGLHLLTLSFLLCSAPMWLASELAGSETADRAMLIAQHVVKKVFAGQVKSWRVRIQAIVFLDEYLEYQPDYNLWSAYSDGNDDGADFIPPDAIAIALTDRDLRVRIRAATSTAELFYLPGIPYQCHQQFYSETLGRQFQNPDAFNFFLTHILWLLNCCIASGGCRNGALLHLYETPFYNPEYSTHLLRGLETLASRLGLGSVQTLWLENVELISLDMLSEHNFKTLEMSPPLSGYASTQARAESELSVIAPSLLAQNRVEYFAELCEAAGTTASEQILRHIHPTMARLLVQVIPDRLRAKKDITSALSSASQIIPVGGTVRKNVIEKGATAIAVEVLNLLGVNREKGQGDVAVKAVLGAMRGADAKLLDLIPIDLSEAIAYPVTGQVPAAEVAQALQYLEKTPSFDRHAACFNSLLQLFARIDRICSAGEQLRLLYQIILVVAAFTDTLKDGRILQLLILEAVSLLNRPDIQTVAFRLVEWGFAQIPHSDGELTRLTDIVARLGRIRQEAGEEMAAGLDAWVAAESPAWDKSPLIASSIEQAAILWPDQMAQHLVIMADPTFNDVAELVVAELPSDSMTICEKMRGTFHTGKIENNRRLFAEKSFWHTKNSFSSDTWTAQGAQAFAATLSEIDGQIEATEPLEERAERDYRRKLEKDPVSLVRVLVVLHLMHVVDKEDRTSRVGAYRILRQLRPSMSGLIKRMLFPSPVLKEVELLQSPLPVELVITPVFTVDNLRDEILSSVDRPDVWLQELSIRLCDISAHDQPFFAQLRSYVLSPTADVAPLLPLLVQACMTTGMSLGKKEERAIATARQLPLEALLHSSLRNPVVSDRVIHAILDIVLHLRTYRPYYRQGHLSYDLWFDLDYMLLSESAIKVGSFATALLFLEIDKGGPGEAELDLFDVRLQKIMMAVYSNVNDPDGFYGVKINDVKESLRLRLNHEGEHLRAFGLHGADLEAKTHGAGSTSALLASARDLHSIGIHQTALAITQSVRTRTDHVPIADDLLFEIAWRTGDWDLPVPPASSTSSAGAFYSALRSLHRSQDQESVQEAVDVAMKGEMLRLKELGSERMTEIQKTVDNLLSLREVALWLGPDVQRALAEGDYTSKNLEHFSEIGSSPRYILAERLHATKMSILTAAQTRESRNLIGDLSSPLNDGLQSLQTKAHLGFSGYARAVGNVQASINAITAVQHIEGTTMSAATADEYGEVLWAQHEHSLALQLAEGMKAELNQTTKGGKGRTGVLAGRIAYWTYRARLLPVKEVHEMFHSAHATLMNYTTSPLELSQMSFNYATFAAEQQAMQRIAPALADLREYRDRRARGLADLVKEDNDARVEETVTPKGKSKGRASVGASAKQSRPSLQSSKEIRDGETRYALRVEWQGQIDSDDLAIKAMEDAIDTMTKLSLKMFATALRHSDAFDNSIMKMCSIWLAHCDCKDGTEEEQERAQSTSRYFTTALNGIPSHKFITLAAQLAARLYKPGRSIAFNDQLNETVKRISQDHPYHILYQIIPLAHGYKRPAKAKGVDEGRTGAAAQILFELGSGDEHTLARTASRDMQKFSDIAISFSLSDPPKKQGPNPGARLEIERNQAIRSFSGLDIPIATCIPPIDKDLLYQSIPKLVRYDKQYTLFGGVHRPKRVTAYDDAGGKYLQLFKGNDDIRQDSVMEQVFVMTNKMLAEDRQTQTRKLRFRTYVVIPLALQTGILEFVAGGESIGEWLKPAHEQYRTGLDVSAIAFRNELVQVQKQLGKDPVRLKAKWEEMTARFRPVMRHYFTEKHKDPMGWFAMRLRYSRSVAVTSMVGWVLGIGDRHLSNIMIDSKNGELIHIDFGHVFESGRALHVPELVPFRLTNDLIDGLGITGIEGTFRRCSEQTIRVLRTNSDLILTIVEVFKHDPLYAWESRLEKEQRLNSGTADSELNKSAAVMQKADRVLAKTREKLGEALSVEYTVNMLVQEARDPVFLASIFTGWQAWF